MSLNIVDIPYSYFPSFNTGKPLFNASIYVGFVGKDSQIPENQKKVTVRQEDGTEIEVAQPVKTSSGGVPSYNGSPVTVLVDGSYSIKVLNSKGEQVYYSPDVTKGVPITKDSAGGITNYIASSVSKMIIGETSGGGLVNHEIGQVWEIIGKWRVKSISSPMTISDFEPLGTIFGNDFGIVEGQVIDETPFNEIASAFPEGAAIEIQTGDYEITPTTRIKQNAFTVFNWNNSVVKSKFSNGSIFYLDCRSSQSFQNGTGHKNLRLGSNNQFNDNTREYDHFFVIDGGWAQSIVWESIFAEPNLAIKSGLHFDLTGAGEIGVPDTTTIKDINFLKAYGSSSAISAVGTSGENARIGQINVKDVLFGAIYSLDFDGVTSTGDCGAIYLKDCGWGAGEFSNLYGNPNVIIGNKASKIDGAKLSSLYQEIDGYSSSQLVANGTALVNGVTMQNCIIDRPESYVDSLIISTKPGDRRIINAVLIDTDIVRPRLTDPRGDWNRMNNSLINAMAGSRGGTLDPIRFSESIDKTNSFQEKISVPISMQVKSSQRPYTTGVATREVAINSATTTTLLVITNLFIEMADTIRIKVTVRNGTGSYQVKVKGFNFGGAVSSVVIDSASGGSIVDIDMNLVGNQSKRTLSATSCRGFVMSAQNNKTLQEVYDPETYAANSDLTLDIETTGGTVDLKVDSVVIEHIQSDFTSYT
ncbi:MAG: hypothetical protein GY782_09985 [Gammaproteobacteria bacterium]|nr:hypothetical protein [Gammaproteobacteria bacterium]